MSWFSRKPKADAWPLRENDLPDPKHLAADPRLTGLEDNAVFRLACFRKHGKLRVDFPPRQGLRAAKARHLVTIGLIFLVMPPLGYVMFIIYSIMLNIVTRCEFTLAGLAGIRPRFIGDLLDACFPARDFVIGAYGQGVSRTTLKLDKRFMIGLFILTSIGLCMAWSFTSVPFSKLFAISYALPTLLLGVILANRRYIPHVRLAFIRRWAKMQRRFVEGSRKPIKFAATRGVFALCFIAPWFGGMMAAMYFLRRTQIRMPRFVEYFIAPLLTYPAGVLLVLGAIFVIGWIPLSLRGMRARKRSEQNFEDLVTDVEFLMNWIKKENQRRQDGLSFFDAAPEEPPKPQA